jgi:hypothetical protein
VIDAAWTRPEPLVPGSDGWRSMSASLLTPRLAPKALARSVPELVVVRGEATDMMHFNGTDRERARALG